MIYYQETGMRELSDRGHVGAGVSSRKFGSKQSTCSLDVEVSRTS